MVVDPRLARNLECEGNVPAQDVLPVLAEKNQIFVEQIGIDVVDDPGGSVIRNVSAHLRSVAISHRAAASI